MPFLLFLLRLCKTFSEAMTCLWQVWVCQRGTLQCPHPRCAHLPQQGITCCAPGCSGPLRDGDSTPICIPVFCVCRSCLAAHLRMRWTSLPRSPQCPLLLLSSPHLCQKCCHLPPLSSCLSFPAPWLPQWWLLLRACPSRPLRCCHLLTCR